MPQTELLKLIFHHDQRMDQLAPSGDDSFDPLAMFTKPDPTFSTLYFSGTLLKGQKFGLSLFQRYPQILSLFERAFDTSFFKGDASKESMADTLESMNPDESILINPVFKTIETKTFPSGETLRKALEEEGVVIFKRANQDGFDLEVFSKENIYLLFFYHLQAMLEPGFRFFSINGKRVHSERHFYFEIWSLEKPPHGFEEVFPETVL
ncbi:MAG: hypothetical protein ED557_15785 [Balneola sp.]|nr:MAG: hypothetical protein ED557_15785 [Balneola sp.]